MEVPHGLFILSVALMISPKGSVVCASQDIQITPAIPLVKLGSSLILNCSVSCLPGKPKWNMFTDATSMIAKDDDQYSTMSIPFVDVDDTFFTCEAKCGLKNPRAAVQLYYFAGPNITADPEELMSGQQFHLNCTVDVHPNVTVKLKLKREETEMATQTQCHDSEDIRFKHCEVAKLTEATQTHYYCEATLQVENSQVTKTALFQLPLKEGSMSTSPTMATSPPTGPPSTAAQQTEGVIVQTKQTHVQSTALFKEDTMNKNSPVKATSPPADPLSTKSLDTEEVPVQRERPRVQSTTAFKEPATVNKFFTAKTASPTSAGLKVEAHSSNSSQAAVISVPLLISLIVATGIGLFCCWKKRKFQEKPEGETCPP